MITLNSLEELTEETIIRIVNAHKMNELPRLIKLNNYYLAKNDINNRIVSDNTKPNNKISNPYASCITDTLTGYFMGEPITYNAEDKALLDDLLLVLEYNDEADENTELAKNASIYGCAYERLYVDTDGMVRFKSIDPKQCIPIFDKTIEENLLAFIRYYDDYNYLTDKTNTIIEVITDKEVITYKSSTGVQILEFIESIPHYFKMVPIAIFKNNEEELGDFERVISLIDAYDKMESDTLNDFEYFVDAYLCLYGYNADSDDIARMKENRVILMDNETKAEWLIKETSDSYIEDTKNRLDKDIHKFSKCPNLSDEEFASNASGIAIKFKTLGTENITAIKERKFKRGIQQRLELLSMFNALLYSGFDWRDIEITFTRNLPTNETDIANIVNQLSDVVSQETLLAQIPFVENVEDEMNRIRNQKAENPLYQSVLTYQTSAMERAEE